MIIAKAHNSGFELVDHKDAFPNASFTSDQPPNDWLLSNNCYPVSAFMEHNSDTQTLESVEPHLIDGAVYTVRIRDLDENSRAVNRRIKQKILFDTILDQVQMSLDQFAKSHQYDSIVNMCSYINSGVDKYANEARLAISLRDSTWIKVEEIFHDVEIGKRHVSGYSDIVDELPKWPTE